MIPGLSHAALDTNTPDPFQYLLTSCEVFVSPEVISELRDITQYQGIHAPAANNVLAVDWFLTDEFGGTNFPLIHASLQGPRIVPTPRLIVDYARNGHLSPEEARTLITTISPHRSWENRPYVTQLLHRLEE
ncbi:hypothetical protein [Haloarcula sp. Atlit-7R]|uniref:hypothetical protein n=1 Tax=Haloarcula sp. Atlit-7R TaxID=2282125 RepID=UPI0026D2CBE1